MERRVGSLNQLQVGKKYRFNQGRRIIENVITAEPKRVSGRTIVVFPEDKWTVLDKYSGADQNTPLVPESPKFLPYWWVETLEESL